MLIFVIPTSYPNPSNPVANPFIKEQVAALSKINANIVVLNVRKMPTKSFFKNKKSGVFFENDGCSDIVYNNHKTFFEKYLVCFNQWLFTRSMRKLYLEAVKKYGKPDVIYAHFYSAADAALKITKSENIGSGLVLWHGDSTIIFAESVGENCEIWHNVTIGRAHGLGRRPRIGNNVKVCAGAIVIGDIEIGDNVVIGAGAVVTKSVPANSVVVGNPARIIKTL